MNTLEALTNNLKHRGWVFESDNDLDFLDTHSSYEHWDTDELVFTVGRENEPFTWYRVVGGENGLVVHTPIKILTTEQGIVDALTHIMSDIIPA